MDQPTLPLVRYRPISPKAPRFSRLMKLSELLPFALSLLQPITKQAA